MFIYYNVRPLSQERIPEAFPVVAFLDEQVTPQQWSDYASAVGAAQGQGDGHGIMALQDPQSRIIGLSVYYIRPDLQRGRVLVIENFAVVALIGAQRAASTLLAAMEALARDRDCPCLAISLLDRTVRRSPKHHRSQAGRLFKGAGFQLDLARLSKCFDPTATGHLDAAGSTGPSESAQARH